MHCGHASAERRSGPWESPWSPDCSIPSLGPTAAWPGPTRTCPRPGSRALRLPWSLGYRLRGRSRPAVPSSDAAPSAPRGPVAGGSGPPGSRWPWPSAAASAWRPAAAGAGPRPTAGTALRVVGRTSLSPRHTVHLLSIGQRVLIVGTGPQGAPSLLGELTDPDDLQRLVPRRAEDRDDDGSGPGPTPGPPPRPPGAWS